MQQPITLARAVTAVFMRRIVHIAMLAAAIILAVAIIASAVLAYFFTVWWWLLAIPFVIAFSLFLLARFITLIIVKGMYPHRLSTMQHEKINSFIDTIQATLEARATPLPLIALICIKDVLFHRDIITVKKIVKDTANLRNDYKELEKLFN